MHFQVSGAVFFDSEADFAIHSFLRSFFAVALLEEGAKWLVMYLLTFKNKHFGHLFDGIIYSIFTCLGFVVVENFRYAFIDGWNTFVLRVETHVPIDGFDDNGFVEQKRINPQHPKEPIVQIPTSELVRENSLYQIDEETSIKLYQHILNEVERRYGNGIECFEFECLFNDYFYENGEEAFNSSDLSQHFNKYDIIIPYVKSIGQVVPLRKNTDGTPKKFRIIGIYYLYDGLLKQKLQVQEERYDVD
jgi:hypothetical protein